MSRKIWMGKSNNLIQIETTQRNMIDRFNDDNQRFLDIYHFNFKDVCVQLQNEKLLGMGGLKNDSQDQFNEIIHGVDNEISRVKHTTNYYLHILKNAIDSLPSDDLQKISDTNTPWESNNNRMIDKVISGSFLTNVSERGEEIVEALQSFIKDMESIYRDIANDKKIDVRREEQTDEV